MKRHLTIALVASMLAFSGSAAFAANNSNDNMDHMAYNNVYSAMDSNSDGMVSQDEFDAYYADAGLYDTWDVNDDGLIDDQEFADGLWGFYDDNDDGYVSDVEWEDGVMVDDRGENGFWDF